MEKKFNKFVNLYFVFFICSVVGWIYEFLWFFVKKNKIINRGFLHGPYLPIYGFGGLALYLLLKRFKNKKVKIKNINITPIIIFVLTFIICTIVEYIGHFILDKYFNIILWNYSKNAFNINGRVCLEASRNFAIGGTFAYYFIQPFFEKIIKKINKDAKDYIFVVIFLSVIFDFLFTCLF